MLLIILFVKSNHFRTPLLPELNGFLLDKTGINSGKDGIEYRKNLKSEYSSFLINF